MLTVRPFRNDDPPRLLELWRRTQRRRDGVPPLPSLSLERLQTQVLGLPMLDRRSLLLAFDNEGPVGYVHTTFVPDDAGYSFDYTIGQICFLCVDSTYSGAPDAAAALIRGGEDYLSGLGAQTIFGGSPAPSAPFYSAIYGGSEAIAFLHSDETIINAFHEENYNVDHITTQFHFDLQHYTPIITPETVGYDGEIEIKIREVSKAKTWWEGCALANGIWFDATAFLVRTNRAIAQLRTRVTCPDTENAVTMYDKTWLASLMSLRIHPDFDTEGVKRHLLGKMIQHLAAQNQIVRVVAHTIDHSPLYALLRDQCWQECGSGTVFVKNIERTTPGL